MASLFSRSLGSCSWYRRAGQERESIREWGQSEGFSQEVELLFPCLTSGKSLRPSEARAPVKSLWDGSELTLMQTGDVQLNSQMRRDKQMDLSVVDKPLGHILSWAARGGGSMKLLLQMGRRAGK